MAKVRVDQETPLFKYPRYRNIHLIGIGGIGMSGIAQLLKSEGYEVTGSDIASSETIRQLTEKGISCFLGHDATNIRGADVVVYSSAISPENPEILAAKSSGILLIPRADMLAEIMRHRQGIAIAGAHGKTTTTSMVGWILKNAGCDPTIVVGGRMDNFGGTNACLGSGPFLVIEGDESDGSFGKLSPSIAVVTNIDEEHLDFHVTMERLVQSFESFAEKVPFYGLAILCVDDPRVEAISQRLERRKVTYGFSKAAEYRITDYSAANSEIQFSLVYRNTRETIVLRTPGRHNALNAVAALAVADEIGIPRNVSVEALHSFRGVQRRFQLRGKANGVEFYDDYAHHPTEIRATLAAARERFPSSRLRVLFQPHRFSRVSALSSAFAGSFEHCDEVRVTEVYAAGESKVPEINSESIAALIRSTSCKNASAEPAPLSAAKEWIQDGKPGDVVLTLGAGDLPKIYRELF